jgi:BCD family chlorophyll transporter-like MFS transporter
VLIMAGLAQTTALLRVGVLAMGVANGVFAIGAIGAMIALVNQPGRREAGVRMGLYGTAQAIAFGVGGFAGAALSDVGRALLGSPALGYTVVFLLEAMLFVLAAWFVGRTAPSAPAARVRLDRDGDSLLAAVG